MLLEVRNLNVSYKVGEVIKRAVKNVSFSVKEGEIYCIVGESGSGKSTILKAIMGILPPNAIVEGEIIFKGINLLALSSKDLNALRGKEISYIFQEPGVYLDPLFKVGDQIKETCLIHNNTSCREKTLIALQKAGIPSNRLEQVYNSYPHQLSGGLKQRVNIADAIVNNPPLLLADEPTTALDLCTQKKILQLFKKLKEEGKTIILITHDWGVVWEVADRVMVLKEGIKIEENNVFDLYLSPKADYTQHLLSIFKELGT
jgi:peptide/nickel transport system ATP-binding protein